MSGNGQPQRYKELQRRAVGSKSRGSILYRLHKKNQQKRTRTPAEVEAASKRRETEKEYFVAIQAGQEEVFAIAERIHAEFPHHESAKIYRTLVQSARKAFERRQANDWNAFQSMKAEEFNAGTSF